MRTLSRLLIAGFLFLSTAVPSLAPPRQGSPNEVIGLINGYRASNGLPAYAQDGILMQIAQGQADYLAATQGATGGDIHTGPGGSRPRDRAYTAGYGGGTQIFISEIAKYGMGETSQSALAWWQQSPNHNPTLLASTYVHIGCGVANDGTTRYYYVCVTGYSVGGSYSGSSTQSAQSPALPVMIPVTKAEPRADGSLVHIIRTGQTLWTLAAVYEVSLQQILDLNGYTESQVVYIGEEVIIAPPGSYATLEPTLDPNATPTRTPTATPSPTATRTPASQPTAAQLAAVDEPQQPPTNAGGSTSVHLVVGVALVSILGVIVASFFIQRPAPEPEPDENDPFAPIN